MAYRYSLLPTHGNGSDSPRMAQNTLPGHLISNVFHSRRYARIFLFALFSTTCFLFLLPRDARPWLGNSDFVVQKTPDLGDYPQYPTPRETIPADDTRPPLFERYAAYEQEFPQHKDSLPSPNDSERKYVYFSNRVWGVGWGNALQEMILNAQLAYESDRTFVFGDYAWEREGAYANYNGKAIPARIPLSALLAGPLAGYPYSNATIAETHPRAVSWQYYNEVCPESQRVILDPRELMKAMPENVSAAQIMSIWVEKLRSIEDRCIEIKKDTTQLFDYHLFGSTRLHDILPSLINSPILKDFSWSPLVHYAFRRNQHHFVAQRTKSLLSILFPYLPRPAIPAESCGLTPTTPVSQTQSLPLLALHLRRGDFIEHCDKLNGWNSTYTGYNTLPGLPDRFFAENATLFTSMTPDERKDAYNAKCLVDIDKVRKRVVRAVKEWREERLRLEREHERDIFGRWSRKGVEERVNRMLRKVYVMTNGDRQFLDELRAALITDAYRSTLRSYNDENFKKEDSNSHAKSTLPPSSSNEFDFNFVWSWDEISTSRDLELGWESKHVAQAMDMYVGQRAEVFIGNGFSSLTANVVLLRTIAGVEPWRTRFF